MPPPTTILALDGGGIRGLIPALVLAEIERRTALPTARLFDLVAGTSTGGILALALARPGPGGERGLPAADIAALYREQGHRIFSRSLLHRIAALENLLDEKYEAEGLEAVLRERLGETRLSEAATEVVVTAYELEGRQPWFFARHKARRDPAYDFPMWQVARATSAAPTYFEPLEVTATSPPGGLVDGGVFANNPVMCAWVEAHKVFGPGRDWLVVSMGTGQHTRPIHHRDARGWGVAKWARPILDVVFDGVADTVDHQMGILCPSGPDGRQRYYRFQRPLDSASDDLDDASPRNVLRLEREAARILEDEAGALEELCGQLVQRAAAPG